MGKILDLSQYPPFQSIRKLVTPEEAWESFVGLTLDLTIRAYEIMRNSESLVTLMAKSKETSFSAVLMGYMWKVKETDNAFTRIMIVPEAAEQTEGMREGEEDPDKAGKIDISILDPFICKDPSTKFIWEAKLVADRSICEERHNSLNGKYVKNGILRFVEGKYAKKLSSGGMIGYIISGKAADIVPQINQSILEFTDAFLQLSEADYLQRDEPYNNFTEIYASDHLRKADLGWIKIQHLFLEF